jgi:CheY-like chemotaxis protein
LGAFETSDFDLAIVDVFMPDMGITKLIKALRERHANLPIIAISGVFLGPSKHTVHDYLPNMIGLPSVVCLQKPFRPKELLEAIQKVIAVAA